MFIRQDFGELLDKTKAFISQTIEDFEDKLYSKPYDNKEKYRLHFELPFRYVSKVNKAHGAIKLGKSSSFINNKLSTFEHYISEYKYIQMKQIGGFFCSNRAHCSFCRFSVLNIGIRWPFLKI